MHPHNNLEHQSLPITSLSRTLYSPKLLLLNYGPNRDKEVLAAVMMLIMMMMTYLSHYSFSAQGWDTKGISLLMMNSLVQKMK